MATDLFEQLAECEVPPVPERLERDVHEQVNKDLLAGQLIDFALRTFAFAAWHLLTALAHWFVLTLTGRPLEPPPGRNRDPR